MIVDSVISTESRISGHEQCPWIASLVAMPWSHSVENHRKRQGLYPSIFLSTLLLEGVQSSRKTRIYLVRVLPIYLISPEHTGPSARAQM